MIKHIVMFKMLETAIGRTMEENIADACERLSHFKEEIPTRAAFQYGVNRPEAAADNCELALVCDFEDMDALKEYKVHPTHVAFGKYIHTVMETRVCIDYEY